ncbi:RIP metalloprotease RseP [Candidatus Curtissbacteria bacterium]|nr:RIP metalloprotease RseP [Candidatus Curtissbacteria bacterium]
MVSIIIFILILSILVLIHELGHFIMAKRAGIGVEEFGFGLPPRAWGKKIKGTIYSLNWLPFGGFVRLVGEDPTDKNKNEKNSFYVKSILQRTGVVVAGVVMNLLLAVIIFYFVIFALGFKVVVPRIIDYNFAATTQSQHAVVFSASKNPDLIDSGELILRLDNKKVENSNEIYDLIKSSEGKLFEIELENSNENYAKKTTQVSFLPQPYILSVVKDSVAEKAGIKDNDVLVSIDGEIIATTEELINRIRSSEGKELTIVLYNLSDNQKREVKAVPSVDANGKVALGIEIGEILMVSDHMITRQTAFDNKIEGISVGDAYKLTYQNPSEKILSGFTHSYNILAYSMKVFGQLIGYSIREKDVTLVSEGVSGPVGIAQVTSQAVALGPISVLQLMALLSLNLAFINILPLPALDGGRFFFIIVEAVTRRKVYPSLEKWVHTIGFALLLALTLLITYNDIAKLIR